MRSLSHIPGQTFQLPNHELNKLFSHKVSSLRYLVIATQNGLSHHTEILDHEARRHSQMSVFSEAVREPCTWRGDRSSRTPGPAPPCSRSPIWPFLSLYQNGNHKDSLLEKMITYEGVGTEVPRPVGKPDTNTGGVETPG